MHNDIHPEWIKHFNTHGRNKMSKNPFEIRSEMLHLAKEYMDQQLAMNRDFAEKAFEEGQKTFEDFQDVCKMYTMDDLMAKAKEMYSFVSEKGDK